MRRGLIAVPAVLVCLLGAAPAAAHTHLAGLEPEPEATLATPPREVALTFNRPVDLVGRAAAMTNGGRDVAIDVLRRGGGSLVLLRPKAPLRAGRVDVRFRVLSEDGHVLRGRYGFRVRRGAAAPPPAGASVTPRLDDRSAADTAAAVTHGAHHLLFVLAAGLLLAGPVVLAAAGVAWPAGGLRAVALLAALASVLTASLTWAAADGASAWRALLPASVWSAGGTSAGGAWLLRAGLWALIAALPRVRWLRIAALEGIALSVAIKGHAGTHGGAESVIVDALHLLAAGTWLGGLAVLAVVSRRPAADRAAATRAFSGIAVPAFAVLLLTGVANGLLRLGGPEIAGGYGALVVAKLGLALAILAVAAAGLRARRAAAGGAQLGIELTLGSCALVLAAILVETAPPS